MACAMPSEVAALIEEFVPWSDELLDDMLKELTHYIYWVRKFKPPMKGIGSIAAFLSRETEMVKRRVFITHIKASVHVKRSAEDYINGIYETPDVYSKRFTNNRTGLKEAIEWARDQAKTLKRRGLCAECLATEPPVKRLRVGNTNQCATCFFRGVCQ